MNRVDTSLASAGTGKTHTLVRTMARAIADGADPSRIVATTFTVKAAGELVERVRAHLVEEGRVDEAVELLGARMGTVNSVSGRIVSEFAMELGRSPASEVIPEQSLPAVFATAADEAIAGSAAALNQLSEALGLAERDLDWRSQVLRIVALARSNGIGTERFADCAERSVRGLLGLLPEQSEASAEDLAGDLRREVGLAIAAAAGTSLKSGSAGAMDALRTAEAIQRRGEDVPWSLWAKLSKPRTPKADEALFRASARAAAAHARHPRLRRDLRRFVELSFSCAATALAAYQDHKAERGLVDFVDQEALALEVLRDPSNRDRLRETIGHVFVDEVQDSSPLQVALFAEMARIAPRSVWVGDPKQSIYGFRGTDAGLTLAAAREAAADTGGSTEVLSTSWRSRPGLCAFVNDAFVPAFEATGLPRDGTAFTGAACDDAGLAGPPLSVWHLEGRNKTQFADAVAGGVVSALADPDAWPVREGAGVRGLRSGDVAILCRGNDDVAEVASALSRCGLPVAVERGSLFGAPEAQLVASALRWVADRDDRLALVEMARLVGDPTDESAWLSALASAEPDVALAALVPFAGTLDDLRERQVGSTPGEIVDGVILATGVVDVACRWGDAAERLHQLEAVRGAAAAYGQECTRLRSPATLAGLVAWLATRQTARPRSQDPDAVQVMTYHRAKGLEWPVVVLGQLERGARSSPFGVAVECDGEPAWRDPLANRWLRLWVWPYGRQTKDVQMDASAAASDVGLRAARVAREEATRLLYVGMTRPRDHLVLTVAGGRLSAALDVLDVGSGSHVRLPAPGGASVTVAGRSHPVRSVAVRGVGRDRADDVTAAHLPASLGTTWRRPLRLRPSAASAPRGTPVVRTELGGRLALVGDPEMDLLGEALHAFLACDDSGLSEGVRRERARAILERWGVSRSLAPADAVAASDRLWAFIRSRFPDARVRREVPVHALVGGQEVVGRIDLLVEDGEGFAVVDHKSFPGRRDLWEAKAASHAPQLALYADAVTSVTGGRCRGTFVHMPIVGVMAEVGPVAQPT
jgi:ATP-dependent exoDNAse (exonuclease V) beta subunit